MFSSIESITNFGVFKSYVAPEDLPPFARRNVFYGWNYSGKTTLSRVFACFERGKTHPDFFSGQFQFRLDDGAHVTAQSIQSLQCPIRVFNSDCVRENVRFDEGLSPVLLIGAANVALQDRLALLGRLIEHRARTQTALRGELQAIDMNLDEHATAAATTIRQSWGRNPYTRVRLRQDAARIAGNHEKYVLTDDELEKKKSIRSAEERPHVPLVQPPDELAISHSHLMNLANSTAHRTVVERLAKNPSLEQWVEEGLALHKHEKNCQFCEGELPAALLERLSAHFSDSYAQLRSRVLDALTHLENSKSRLPKLDALHIFPVYRDDFAAAYSKVEGAAAAYNAAIEALRTPLSAKLHALDTQFDIPPIPSDYYAALQESIRALNIVLDRHNKMSANLESERSAAEESLVLNDVASYISSSKYVERTARSQAIEKTLAKSQASETRLRKQRDLIQEQLSEEVRGAEELNKYLRLYFGGDELRVTLRFDKTYLFQRSGQVAKNLSEGERTAIAFSYFLTTLRAKEMNLQECVVFVDDPISSLDSNHIFNTFATIKFALKDVKQLFVSTHNYEFFRMMRGDSFFALRKDQAALTSYYLVRQRARGDSEIVALPLMLLKYNSEYHYLFEALYRLHQDPSALTDQAVLNAPNMFRRLLETYTSFRVPNTAMTLDQRLLRVFPDPVLSQRIYKLVNHLSHAEGMNPAIEFPNSQECSGSLAAFFEALQRDDPKHYQGMLELLA